MLQPPATVKPQWPGNAMASYDTCSLTTVHNRLAQREILRLKASEGGQPQPLQLSLSPIPAMDTFEHDLSFDGEAFVYVIFLLCFPSL